MRITNFTTLLILIALLICCEKQSDNEIKVFPKKMTFIENHDTLVWVLNYVGDYLVEISLNGGENIIKLNYENDRIVSMIKSINDTLRDLKEEKTEFSYNENNVSKIEKYALDFNNSKRSERFWLLIHENNLTQISYKDNSKLQDGPIYRDNYSILFDNEGNMLVYAVEKATQETIYSTYGIQYSYDNKCHFLKNLKGLNPYVFNESHVNNVVREIEVNVSGNQVYSVDYKIDYNKENYPVRIEGDNLLLIEY